MLRKAFKKYVMYDEFHRDLFDVDTWEKKSNKLKTAAIKTCLILNSTRNFKKVRKWTLYYSRISPINIKFIKINQADEGG